MSAYRDRAGLEKLDVRSKKAMWIKVRPHFYKYFYKLLISFSWSARKLSCLSVFVASALQSPEYDLKSNALSSASVH